MERNSGKQENPPTVRADISSPEPGVPSTEASKNKPNDSFLLDTADAVLPVAKDGADQETMKAAAFTESVQEEIKGDDDALI